jgi:hypothetical protein
MLVHRLLLESVDFRRLRGSAGGSDVFSDRFDRCEVVPGEKKLRPLICEGERDSAAGCELDACVA